MATTIAFFEKDIAAGVYPFEAGSIYFYSHQQLLLAMKRAGAEAYFVTGNDSYLGQGRFKRAWTIDKVGEVADFREVGEITADVVFDKAGYKGFVGDDIPLVTDHSIRRLLSDKVMTYEKFGRFQPQTVICHHLAELEAAMEAMPGELVVVKEPWGSGGSEVYIGRKGELELPRDKKFPLLVQEFLDLSEGVPGVAEGVHDLRVLVAGGEIVGATLRQPAAGGLHSNVSRGGSERLLPAAEIPAEVRRVAEAIDAEIGAVPRYYSIDFARAGGRWYLIELNNEPGLFHEATGPLAQVFMDKLAHYLIKLGKQH